MNGQACSPSEQHLSLILAVRFNLQNFFKFFSYDGLISCSRKFCFYFVYFSVLLGNICLDDEKQAIIFTLLIVVYSSLRRIYRLFLL